MITTFFVVSVVVCKALMSDVIHIVGVPHGQARNTKYTKDPVASQHNNTHDTRKQGTENEICKIVMRLHSFCSQ